LRQSFPFPNSCRECQRRGVQALFDDAALDANGDPTGDELTGGGDEPLAEPLTASAR